MTVPRVGMAADVPTRTVTRRQFIAGAVLLPLVRQTPRDVVLLDDAGRMLRDERNDRLEDEGG